MTVRPEVDTLLNRELPGMAAIRESARQNVDFTQRLIAFEGVPFRR